MNRDPTLDRDWIGATQPELQRQADLPTDPEQIFARLVQDQRAYRDAGGIPPDRPTGPQNMAKRNSKGQFLPTGNTGAKAPRKPRKITSADRAADSANGKRAAKSLHAAMAADHADLAAKHARLAR